MGNSIPYQFVEGDDDYLSDGSSLNGDGEEITLALGSMLAQIVGQEANDMPPIIRKKPDLRVFRVSSKHLVWLIGINKILLRNS